MKPGEDSAPPRLARAGRSVSLTLGGGSGADVTVAADGHRVGVEGVHVGGTLGQLHRHHPGLVVGADPVVGLDVGRLQDRLLRGRNAGLGQEERQTSGAPVSSRGFSVNRGATGSGGRGHGNEF